MDTLIKYMKLIGFQSYKNAHKPALTPEHKLKRLSWCLDKVGWGPEQWRKVVWSDESKFMVLGNDGGSRVIRKEGKRYNDYYIIKTKKFGSGSVMLWGCFWAGGYGPLVALDGRVNQDRYIECLDKSYLPWIADVMKNEEGNFVLQEDGASCHTGRISTSWKEDQPLVNSFSFWPAQSPNLNPIEHLWATMEKRIESKRHRIDNAEQLLACIHEEWNNLDLDLAERLVASMTSGCQAVINTRGEITRY